MAEVFEIEVAERGTTTARVVRARDPIDATLILAHGAGAPQSHPFMIDMSERIAARGIDVVTFDFLYMRTPLAGGGRKLPDRTDVLEATWRAAIANVRARAGLPLRHQDGGARLFIGGKSMGGRIASQIAAAGDVQSLAGLVFLGYPLHPANKPKVRRDEHLPRVKIPMLFVQGANDTLGNEKEIGALVKTLPRAELYVVKDGDHSLSVPKRIAGKNGQDAALEGAADAIGRFVRGRKQKAKR